MDGGAWWATVHEVAKSRTRLSDITSLHLMYYRASMIVGKESAGNAGDPSSIPGWGNPLEKRETTHSSILGLPLWLNW